MSKRFRKVESKKGQALGKTGKQEMRVKLALLRLGATNRF